MATFIIKPELQLVHKYLDGQSNYQTEEVVQEIKYTTEWSVFDDEETFLQGFEALLSEYELEDDYDNLLYLTLEAHNRVWEGIQWYYDDYESKKRARELAQMLLLLKETKRGRLGEIAFKSLTQTAKVKDAKLNDWISKTLIDAIEERKFPIGGFGDTVFQMIAGTEGNALERQPLNIDRLREYANKRLVNPKNRIKEGVAAIGLTILAYLQDETRLKASEGVRFSDAQLRFLFKLLTLIKQVNTEHFDSDEIDYLRTLLANNKHS